MPDFVLTQYGGGSGGSAGDACLIQLAKECLVVDFGVSHQRLQLLADLNKQSYCAIVTHFHSDHCGEHSDRFGAKTIWVSKESTMREHENVCGWRKCMKPENNEPIWQVQDENLQVTVFFIAGANIAHPQGENAYSAGVYGVVSCSGVPLFKWLLLGDMVQEAWGNISSVAPREPLHYIKLPHHGCAHNHMQDLFKENVDPSTKLIISGHNSIDAEWNKIKLDRPAIVREQLRVLTYDNPGDCGTTWMPYVRRLVQLRITQKGEQLWTSSM